jgi:hypothetical protein
MMEVPSILMVAPKGMVKEEIFLETPIFSSRVSILTGMVALEVDVENAKAITGKNLLINLTGFSLVKISSMIMYTMKHWMASPIITLIIYFSNGINPSKPRFEKVLVIMQNTPRGANCITRLVISIIRLLHWLRKLEIISAFSPILARRIPTSRANRMI